MALKRMIKNIIKNLVPEPIHRLRYRTNPRHKRFGGSIDSVLNCSISYNQYGGFCVPRSAQHRPAVQSILSGKVWEQETIEYLVKNAHRGDIIHAGTFFGDFLPALSRSRTEDERVWAFEPNAENFRCAQITIIINGLANVQISNVGLGSGPAERQLITEDQAGRSLGGGSYFTDALSDHSTLVPIRSIDDIVSTDRNVSTIHLDVERSETEALSGAILTIKRCLPLLILETIPSEPWFRSHLAPLGYKSHGQVNGNAIYGVS
jgi:FkbM family methyltransferase